MRELCFAVIALAAVAVARGEVTAPQNASTFIVASQCPVFEDVNQIVFIPHESDCTMYYVCHGGKKVPMYCAYMDEITGERLHFDPSTERCEWPGSFDCVGNNPTPNECVGSFKSSHESNCNYYYECVSGRKVLRACGTGLHFNPFAQTCQTPAEAGCDKTTPTPTLPPVANECSGSYKMHHETNCGFYYECVNGKKTLRSCGAGLHFNAFAQTCQTPAEAGCNTATPTPKPTIKPTLPPVAHECVGTYKSPHATNCGFYYECVNGKKVLKACGTGLHFNPFAQLCQTPSEAGCSGSSPTPAPTPKPTLPPVVGKECEGNFKSQHESNCGYYYECVNGKKTLRACGNGLHFNPFAQTCQPAANAGCETTQPTPAPTPRPTPVPTPPPAGNECVGSFKSRHESNCKFYYECVNGKKTLKACATGLHFNPFAQVCQTPSQAGCDASQPTPAPTPRPTLPPVSRECVGNFKSAHETNCGFYYECVNGKKVLRSCGGGLHFNPFAQTCQTPSEAGCTKSATKPTSKPTLPPSGVECYGNFKAPHESQCSYYYECVTGKVTLRSCTGGLHFNSFAQTCQPAAEAGCHNFLNALMRIFRGPHNFPQKVDA